MTALGGEALTPSQAYAGETGMHVAGGPDQGRQVECASVKFTLRARETEAEVHEIE